MVTHDLDTLWRVSDSVAVLANAKVEGIGSMLSLSKSKNPNVMKFFDGPRGRSAFMQKQKNAHIKSASKPDIDHQVAQKIV
jgi:phospholipid/cholesterol/gamma-HCH transport system ATP-binding protein